MKNIMLQLYTSPINVYCMHAYPLSIIKPTGNFYLWLYSNYINLYCHQNFSDCRVPVNFYTDGFHSMYNGLYYYDVTNYFFTIPFIDVQNIDRNTLSYSNADIIEFFCNELSHYGYIMTYVDEYYVPNRWMYQIEHYHHEILIYGYDKDSQLFNVMGYSNNGKIEPTTIKFHEFLEAYNNFKIFDLPDFRRKIYIIRHITPTFSTDKNCILKSLKQYLYCGYDTKFYNQEYLRFGLDVYGSIYNDMLMASCTDANCDIRPFYLLWEHKKLMVNRLRFFIENEYISKSRNSNYILDTYTDIEIKYRQIINMALKYNLTHKTAIIKQIRDEIMSEMKKEKQALEILLDEFSR